jgi:hypothetical protein
MAKAGDDDTAHKPLAEYLAGKVTKLGGDQRFAEYRVHRELIDDQLEFEYLGIDERAYRTLPYMGAGGHRFCQFRSDLARRARHVSD